MQNYRDPPPYPGHSKQVFTNQPGFRQSFSGSETSTDVSLSSTENLATSQRQEPQGEETQVPFYNHLDFGGVDGCGSYSILARLGMPPGALVDSLGKPHQQQQQQQLQQQQQHLGITSTPTSVGSNFGVSPVVSASQNDRFQSKNILQHPYPGATSDILKGISSNDPITSSSSVPSPLYSQGHLTVPRWQLGMGQGHGGVSHPQHRLNNDGAVRTAQQYSANAPSSSVPSRNPASYSASSSSSSVSSTSTVTATMKRLGHMGVGSTGEYSSSSHVSSSSSSFSSSSSSNWSVARTGTSVTSASGLPGPMAEYASTPSSWSASGNQYLSPRVPPVSTYHHPHPYVNTHFVIGSGDSTSSSHSSSAVTPVFNPDANSGGSSSSSSSNVNSISTTGLGGGGVVLQHPQHHQHPLSHSGERLYSQTYSKLLPPPPQYPKKVLEASSSSRGGEIRACRSFEMMDQQVESCPSRPDLRLCASSPGIYVPDSKLPGQSPVRSNNTSCDENDQASIAAKASQMVEMLTEENRALREELASSTVKVAKLLKFEMEIQKVHDSHGALLQSHQKREALWMAMKRKLEERVQILESGSRADGASGKTTPSVTEMELRSKLSEKEERLSRLLSQNQDLSSCRNQLDAENGQLVISVAEQKAHVDILENALLNTQAKVLALEEEQRKKKVSEEKLEQLHSALTSLQQASEKQEKKGREMRQRLEKELESYKAMEKSGAAKKVESSKDDEKSVSMLRKMLHEKDARILQLETEIAGLEQKYVKEATLRQLKMDDSPKPYKEVRMAALEKSSSDMEKLIDEAKMEKLKHMEELHQSNRKVAELEAKVKQLRTQLVEKEAMVKLFQRSPLSLPRSSSLHALCHTSRHSPRPSLIATQATEASESTYREVTTVRHMKTESSSAIELGRKMSMEEDLLAKVQSLNAGSKSDSEEEVQLWHV